jgi:hypothetical protein
MVRIYAIYRRAMEEARCEAVPPGVEISLLALLGKSCSLFGSFTTWVSNLIEILEFVIILMIGASH